jgi:hypothetical protein
MQQAPENLTVEGLNVNVGPYSLAPTVRRNAAGDVGRVPGADAGGAILSFAGDLACKTGVFWQKRTTDRQITRESNASTRHPAPDDPISRRGT